MTRVYYRTLAAVLLLFLSGGALSAQSQDKDRDTIFQIGLGLSQIEWPQGYEQTLSDVEELEDFERVKVNLNLALGGALTQRLYLVGSAQGYGDRVENGSGSFIQFNAYLFGLGLRWYPFRTGLLLGADAGAARVVGQASGFTVGTSDWGQGLGFSAAYDFGRKPTGISLVLGVRVDGLSVEGDEIGATALFLNLSSK